MAPIFGWFDLSGPSFDPSGAAKTLFTAMDGAGTTEDDLIEVLTSHTAKQRVEIRKVFKEKFARDLVEEIQGDTSGSFAKILTALCQDPVDYLLENLIEGIKSDATVACEILCPADADTLKKLRETYKKVNKKELEEEITAALGEDDVAALLKGELNDKRNKFSTEVPVDASQAEADAKAIYDAGEGKWGTDETKFVEIISARTNAQIVAINEAYKKLRNKELVAAITSEIGGALRDVLVQIVKVAVNKTQYFVERLYDFMQGAGTDDSGLIRIIVSRQEVDLIHVAIAFQEKYKMKLSYCISTETSGDFKSTLLAIIAKLL